MDVWVPSVAVTAFLLNESLAVSGCVAGGSGGKIFQTTPATAPSHCALGALLAFSICAMRPMLQSGMLMSQPSSR